MPINKYNDYIGSDIIYSDDFKENTTNEIEKQIAKINQKIVPFIVKANVTIDNESYLVEIIQDKLNGQSYLVKVLDEFVWLPFYDVKIIENEELVLEPLTDYEIEFYLNYHHYQSKTNYFIYVDIYRNETYVLEKKDDYFYVIKRFICATGSYQTPTKRGLFEIKSKGSHFYSRDGTYICYNYLQYDGSYLLHSFPYSLDNQVLDDRLKQRVSSGCVRFSLTDSRYLLENIPLETAILLN